jgi:hypothetical protein
MVEVVAAGFEDELEAETAAGYLRSLGIAARVRFQATQGLPRPMAPVRVIAPLGAFELVVSEADLARARDALAGQGPSPPRPQRFRWLGWILIAAFVLPLLISWIVSYANAR